MSQEPVSAGDVARVGVRVAGTRERAFASIRARELPITVYRSCTPANNANIFHVLLLTSQRNRTYVRFGKTLLNIPQHVLSSIYLYLLTRHFIKFKYTRPYITANRPHRTLRNFVVHPKDKVRDEEKIEFIDLSCPDGVLYILHMGYRTIPTMRNKERR